MYQKTQWGWDYGFRSHITNLEEVSESLKNVYKKGKEIMFF